MKKISLFLITIMIFSLIGCENHNEKENLNGASYPIFYSTTMQTSNMNIKYESLEESLSSFMDDYVKPEDRLVIDYDFPNSTLENYSLYLFPINGTEDEYKLVLYDSNEIIQEIPCGKISGTPEFAFDDVYSGRDLEIFFYDEQINQWQGILFQWDGRKNDRFEENYIRIPKYDEIVTCSRIGILSVIDDNDSVMEKTLYEISNDMGCAVEIRKWTFEKDTKILKIYDCLEDKSIFEGNIALDKDNNIVNEEYYQFLLLYEIPPIRNSQENKEIEVTNADNPSNKETYPNKQEFLSYYGFDNKDPFYQCYDILGNLTLELYFNEETETGCGIHYETFYNTDLEKSAYMDGFSFSSMESGKWENPKTYALKPYGHETNNIKEDEDIEDYE